MALPVEGESICSSISQFILHLFLFFWGVGTASPITGVWGGPKRAKAKLEGADGLKWGPQPREICALLKNDTLVGALDIWDFHVLWGLKGFPSPSPGVRDGQWDPGTVGACCKNVVVIWPIAVFPLFNLPKWWRNTSDPWKQQWMSSTGSKTLQESQGLWSPITPPPSTFCCLRFTKRCVSLASKFAFVFLQIITERRQ